MKNFTKKSLYLLIPMALVNIFVLYECIGIFTYNMGDTVGGVMLITYSIVILTFVMIIAGFVCLFKLFSNIRKNPQFQSKLLPLLVFVLFTIPILPLAYLGWIAQDIFK